MSQKPFQKKVDFVLDLIAATDSHDRGRLSSQLFLDGPNKQIVISVGSLEILKSNWYVSIESLLMEFISLYHGKMLAFLSDPHFKDTNKTADVKVIKSIKELFMLSTKEILALRK